MKRLFKSKNSHTGGPSIDDAEVAAVDDTWMGTTDEQLAPAGDLDDGEENNVDEVNETPSRRERRQQRQQERKEKHEARGAGWRGMRGPGGGYAKVVEPAQEFRGTTAQVCGLWPHAAGSASPKSGVPLGHHILNKSTVFCDPISWFEESKLIGNPSAFVLGLPGLGKSTIVRRMEIGLAGNVQPMVLGDTKPDHRVPTEMLGGQVVELARGRGSLNVLDMGALDAAAARLTGSRARALRENAHGRRLTMMSSLIALARKGVVGETESAVLSAALRVLADTHPVDKPAVLADLVTLLENPPQSVRTPTLDRGDDTVYRQEVRALQLTVSALLEGPLGSVFAQPTTT
ncbi:MAG: hypothetical protein QG597_4339, partial [Actinomycetota bacterium]|nr:hypothetical protein [Actinomycetota bacterium]